MNEPLSLCNRCAVPLPPPPVEVVYCSAADVPEIDGRLDDAVWSRTAPVSSLTRYMPSDGGPPPGVTEFHFAQDDEHLYVGVRVEGSASSPQARLSPRDQLEADDTVTIRLDTNRDGVTGYVFNLNPLGVQADWMVAHRGKMLSWDAQLRAKGQLHEDGYTLEVAIPYRSLEYPEGLETQTWGVLVYRDTPSDGSSYIYPHAPLGYQRPQELAAPLVGLRPPQRRRQASLTSTLAGSGTQEHGAWSPAPEGMRPGGEVSLGLGGAAMLHVTANPDFSQVAPDSPVVQLNGRRAITFSERRPFFTSTPDVFDDAAGTLYSRAIVEPYYAAKAVSRGVRVTSGFMHALDRSPAFSLHEQGTPGFDEADLEDAQVATTLARARLSAFGSGYIGFTGAHKAVLGRSANAIGSMDLSAPLNERWTLAGHATASHLSGEQPWTGAATQLAVERRSGTGWGVQASVRDSTPRYRMETGSITYTGETRAGFEVDYTLPLQDGVLVLQPEVFSTSWRERSREGALLGGARLKATVGGVHVLELGIERRVQREVSSNTREALGLGPYTPVADEDFVVLPNGYKVWGKFKTQLSAGWSIRGSAYAKQTLDWNSPELVPAMSRRAQLSTQLLLGRHLRCDLSGTAEQFQPEGAPPELGASARASVTAQLTPALGARWIGDLTGANDDSGSLSNSVMLYGVLRPGTELYVGYADEHHTSTTSTERTVFIKLSGRIDL